MARSNKRVMGVIGTHFRGVIVTPFNYFLLSRGSMGIFCSIEEMAASRAMVTPVLPTPAEQWTRMGSAIGISRRKSSIKVRKCSGLLGTPWSGQEVY